LLVAAAFLTYYLIESRTYVTTDNAQVDGSQISITAPTSGILIDWHGQQGTQLQQNAPVGRIEIQGGFMQPQMVIRAPAAGVVAVDNGVPGSFVTAGTQLAIAYDNSGVFFTARVDETDIDAVHVGAPVKISVDAFPTPTSPAGCRRSRRGLQECSRFSRSPTPRQLPEGHPGHPVKITIDDLQNLPLVRA
jgi:multidrug resistance efflux pump